MSKEKYCCKEFEEVVDDLCGGSPIESGEAGYGGMEDKNKWYIMWEIDMDSSGCSYRSIKYCPFCGVKLEEKE